MQSLAGSVYDEAIRSEHEVVELALLLPRWQMTALEAAAADHGMTVGQMIRKLLGEFISSWPNALAGLRR
jgi:hypothetical protein